VNEPTVTILRGAIYEVHLPRRRSRKPPVLKEIEPHNRVWFDLRRARQ
jgi:hypothetical protein